VLVGYADGCIRACVTSTRPRDNTRSAYATIARQQAGRTLLARYDRTRSSTETAGIALAPQAIYRVVRMVWP
jgi:hypothetical protein